MTGSVETYLSEHAQDARALLERLCRQPSIAAQNTGMAEMADLVESLLRETGFATRRLTAGDYPPIVYGELRGSGDTTILLYDHYDVQPPEPLELWQSEPFEPAERDGKLYARGASDDKGEIAARLSAIRALRAVHGTLPVTLKWIIEGEEEVGSAHFEEIIRPHAELLHADAAFWEGTGFDVAGRPVLSLGAKGLLYIQLETEALSVDAHSGNAPILPSAAWRLVSALATLRSPEGKILIPGFYDHVLAPTPAQLEAIANQPDADEVIKRTYGISAFNNDLAGAAMREQESFAPTCNIAGLLSGYTGGGIKTVLPAKAMAKIDFRLVPDQDPHDIVAKLRDHLDSQGYSDVKITVLGASSPVVTPIEEPLVQRVAAIARAFEGKEPSIVPSSGGSLPLLEALKKHVGLPGLSVPGDPVYWANGAHSPNEHIRLEDLDRAVRFNCHLFMSLGS